MISLQLELFKPPADQPSGKVLKGAREIVQRTLADCLPPEVPASYKKIAAARFTGRNSIVATLVMFDDLPGIVHLTRWRYGWSHRWEWLPGQYLVWADGIWQRIDEDSTS